MTLKNASICTACGKHRTQHPSSLCAACRREKPTNKSIDIQHTATTNG